MKEKPSPQPLLLTLGLLLIAGLIWLLIVARPLFEALVIAGLLAYLLDPLVRRLGDRFSLTRAMATNVVYSLVMLTLAAIIAALGTAAWGQIPRLLDEFRSALTEIGSWMEQPIVVLGFQFEFQTWLQGLQRSTGNALATMPSGSFSLVADITSNLLWTLVVFVTLYYLLKDGPRIKSWLVDLLPLEYQAEGRHLLDDVDRVWGSFLRIQLLIFLILGALMGASTVLIIWLFRSGWLPLSPVGLAILLVLVYAAVQQVDNLWLRPQLLGRTLKLHPGLVFVALIAALALSGLLGAIIVVPVLATLKVIGGYTHAKLLGRPLWSESEARQEATQEDTGPPSPIAAKEQSLVDTSSESSTAAG